MATPAQYGIPFTPAEEAVIQAAYQSVLTILQSKVNFNMTDEERQGLSKVGMERAPYVLKSINDYAQQFVNLNGQAYPLALASVDLANYGLTSTMLTTLGLLTEITTEIQMVSGHFAFEFMRDQYENAKRYRGNNVAGAQVVYDGLKGCFEGQGPQNPATPPQP
jgi:hypothetical protein